MNKLYTIAGISIVALSLFSAAASAHYTGHKHKRAIAHSTKAHSHQQALTKLHAAKVKHHLHQTNKKYSTLIAHELKKPHPSRSKLIKLHRAKHYNTMHHNQQLRRLHRSL